MEDHREDVYKQLVQILCDNWKLFPIVKQIRAYEKFAIKSKGDNLEYRTWYAVNNHIAINVVFATYYDALMKFWHVSDIHFKDALPSLVIKASIQHYFPKALLNKKEAVEIQTLLEKLTYKPKKS